MGNFLPAGFYGNKPGPLAGSGLQAMEQDRIATLELPGAQPLENLAILDGSISPTRAAVIVDTEGGAPADDLSVISTTLSDGTTLHDGMELTIRAKDQSRVVTVKNSAAVNGILTADGKDVVLAVDWWLTLRLESGSWRVVNLAQPQKVTSKTDLGLMQVGQHLEVTPEGVVDASVASESKQGIGRSATTAEVESGVTGENGPAWVTPESLKNFVVKTGFVLPFAGNGSPDGYLLCNGGAISRTTYADLFAAIGTLYGAGNGSTTFNLPQLTDDRFIQGSGTSGTNKAAGLPELSGTLENTPKYNIQFVFNKASGAFSFVEGYTSSYVDIAPGGTSEDRPYKVNFIASNANAIYGNSNTVQTTSLTMRYYIKY